MIIENAVAKKLIKQSKTLALAESCTGGLVGHRLTSIPGSSQFLLLGLVTYSNQAKTKFLKIPAKMINIHGAVSKPVAIQMAKEARNLIKADYSIAITGIAGPSGATETKPVGLTFIAVGTASKIICKKFLLKGTRKSIKSQAASNALKLLLSILK